MSRRVAPLSVMPSKPRYEDNYINHRWKKKAERAFRNIGFRKFRVRLFDLCVCVTLLLTLFGDDFNGERGLEKSFEEWKSL